MRALLGSTVVALVFAHGIVDARAGDDATSLTIVEYSDHECPYCARAHAGLRAAVARRPDIRIEHRNFPLDPSCNPAVRPPFHRDACALARAAICAGEQGRLRQMNDALYANRDLGARSRNWRSPLASTSLVFAGAWGLRVRQSASRARSPPVSEPVSPPRPRTWCGAPATPGGSRRRRWPVRRRAFGVEAADASEPRSGDDPGKSTVRAVPLSRLREDEDDDDDDEYLSARPCASQNRPVTESPPPRASGIGRRERPCDSDSAGAPGSAARTSLLPLATARFPRPYPTAMARG